MSRTRALRRAHRERVIRRRLRHIREWTPQPLNLWGHEVPGRWAKMDPYAHGRCGVCHEAFDKARLRMQKRLDREAVREYILR